MSTHPMDNQRDKRTFLIGGLLIVMVGVYSISKSIFFQKTNSLVDSAITDSSTQSRTPLIAADVLLKKIQNDDSVAIIDVRDGTAYKIEHIAHSLPLSISTLQNFSPIKDELVVIIYAENDPGVFETIKNIMNQKSFAYFFLKGGFESWKSLNAPTVSAGDPNSFIDQSKITYLSIEECKKLLAQKIPPIFILDVQTEENFKKRHIAGAINIPLDQLEKRINEIPAGKQIIVYGENDLISFQGGVRLSDLNIFSAHTLTDGKYLSNLSGLPFEP